MGLLPELQAIEETERPIREKAHLLIDLVTGNYTALRKEDITLSMKFVYRYIMKLQFDKTLQWPFAPDTTIEMLSMLYKQLNVLGNNSQIDEK